MSIRELTEEERHRLREIEESIPKFESQKRWSDLTKALIAKAELVPGVEEKVALYTQAATIYLERSANQVEAIKCLEMVLELDPANLRAITQLKELYEKRRDWEKLLRVLERETMLLDPGDRALRYAEMAQLATEKLRKPEASIDLWRKVLEYEPDHREALGALASLYEKMRDWRALAEVIEKQCDLASGEELKQLLGKLGSVYGEKLNDDEGAARVYEQLLTFDPEDKRIQEQLKRRYVALRAWDRLEAFLEPAGKTDELIKIYEREVGNKELPRGEQIALLFRIARLWLAQGKPDRAIKAYEKVLELDPEHVEAAVALSPLYEEVGDWKKVANVYEIRLRHLERPEERIQLLQEAARIYEEKLKQSELALGKFIEAFVLDPSIDFLRENVQRLGELLKKWDSVVEAYTKVLSTVEEASLQVVLRFELGGFLWKIGRIDEAIAAYRAIVELDALYEQSARHAELLETIERRLEIEGDPETRRSLAYRKAALLAGPLDRLVEAIEAYQQIMTEWGDEEIEAYAALE
ncbi:MAG: tetratricopeptide repeat protein, partial [Sandaracinaceae bacterium]|nr:tetratricopeptide repeat protein [Sandaracinaceae bacterium]